MCNQYKLKKAVQEIADAFRDLGLPLGFPEGPPNVEPRDQVCITDTAPIVRSAAVGAAPELVQRPWSWKAPNGAPVFNFRSEGRRFPTAARCVIPTDGFYEFTAPDDPKAKRKDRWLFTMAGEDLFFIAGHMRGEAWTMLTCAPGPDMAPFHTRQVVVLSPLAAAGWLTGGAEAELLCPASAGTLTAERVA